MATDKNILPVPVNSTDRLKLVRGGKEYFDLLLQLIRNATETIHLQTYIYDDDETGIQVAEALKEAVKRKVSVHLLADGYASQVLSKAFISELKEAGIHFRFFEPLIKSRHFYFGRRMHHKVFVVDAKYALVGGINITNRYNDLPDQPAWLDFALYAEGEIARQLCVLCWKSWNGFPSKMGITPCEKNGLLYLVKKPGPDWVSMRRNDWVRRKKEISQTYQRMFREAQSHITIVCSYFLPGKNIRRLLSRAAARGVKIRVITAGPSDVMVAKRAERWLYDWLLRNKIEIYEYQPTVLHAKLAVCDGKWLTVGSYNINNISAYASVELNLEVHDPVLAGDAEQQLETILQQDCIRITHEGIVRTRNIFRQFSRWFSYQFIRVAFFIITFYYKQER